VCFPVLFERSANGPGAVGHRQAVVAVAGDCVQPPQLVAAGVDGIGGREDAVAQRRRHCTNLVVRAGAARRSANSSSRVVTVTDAPAISSEVMYSPT